MKVKDFTTLVELREQYQKADNKDIIEMTEQQMKVLCSLFLPTQTPFSFFDGAEIIIT